MAAKVSKGVPASEVREARAFLQNEGLLGKVSPKLLAGAKLDIGKGFKEALAVLAALLTGDQGRGPSPETEDAL